MTILFERPHIIEGVRLLSLTVVILDPQGPQCVSYCTVAPEFSGVSAMKRCVEMTGHSYQGLFDTSTNLR